MTVGWAAHAAVLLHHLALRLMTEALSVADRFLLPAPKNLHQEAKQGQQIRGEVAEALNQAVPEHARP